MRPAQEVSDAGNVDDTVQKQQEVEDDFFPPFPNMRESIRSRPSDHVEDQEKPRRRLRNVPRPDYAEMVANKDPWNAPEMEIEVGPAGRK